jgi:hypothetical protein
VRFHQHHGYIQHTGLGQHFAVCEQCGPIGPDCDEEVDAQSYLDSHIAQSGIEVEPQVPTPEMEHLRD